MLVNRFVIAVDAAGQSVASTLDKDLVRIRVSSKHLMLASSYFKRNLGSGLVEGHIIRSHGHIELPMSGQDPEAMLIIMNIIHGRTREIPISIDVNILTKIAVLVDYLQCHEVTEPYLDKWIEKTEEGVPKTHSRQPMRWLCISIVFEKAGLFKDMARTVLRQASGLIKHSVSRSGTL